MNRIKLRIRVQDMDEDAAKLAVVELNRLCCWQQEEIERLQAIVDKLPKTKDGVPVVPGMRVWFKTCGHVYSEVVENLVGNFCLDPDNESRWMDSAFDEDRCYSTREAAEKAQ